MENNDIGIIGWLTTIVLSIKALFITPQSFYFIMAGIAAGCTAVYYVIKTIKHIKNEKY